MRIASDILYRWVRSTGRGDSLPADQDLAIPPAFYPVLTIPGPFSFRQGYLATVAARESVFFSTQLTRSNAAGATQDLITFGRGLWRVQVSLSYIANYTIVDASAEGGRIRLIDADSPATAQDLINFPPFNGAPSRGVWANDMLFAQDSWSMELNMGTNGAGQTHTGYATLMALRLN